jgi:hypothetical protein
MPHHGQPADGNIVVTFRVSSEPRDRHGVLTTRPYGLLAVAEEGGTTGQKEKKKKGEKVRSSDALAGGLLWCLGYAYVHIGQVNGGRCMLWGGMDVRLPYTP